MKEIKTYILLLCVTACFYAIYSFLYDKDDIVPHSLQDDVPRYIETSQMMSNTPNGCMEFSNHLQNIFKEPVSIPSPFEKNPY